MKSDLELQIDILFKERELLYLTSHIATKAKELERLRVEYQQIEEELKILQDEFNIRSI